MRTGRLLAAFVALALMGCSDDNGNGDKDTGTTDGPVKTDGPTKDLPPGSEGLLPDGPPVVKPDIGNITFAREVTFGYDTGIPAVKLSSQPGSKGHLKVAPETKLLPVEVRKIMLIPASAHSFTLSVAKDQGGAPGVSLASRQVTIKPGDVDKPYTIDLSADNVVVNGTFWVTMTYPSSLTAGQMTVYGSTASSGHVLFDNPTYPVYTTNFDEIMHVTVGTPNTDTPTTPGKKGDTCSYGVDCQSGYCSGKRCVETCTSDGDCGSGGKCYSFHLGKKICVKGCTKSADCATGAFCLTDTTFLKPAGVCIKGGPFATGKSCQYQYHTICAEGQCSACDTDPTKCEDPGTCKKAP